MTEDATRGKIDPVLPTLSQGYQLVVLRVTTYSYPLIIYIQLKDNTSTTTNIISMIL